MAALTAKQQAWIAYYNEGRTAAEAARLAGYVKSPAACGARNLKKLTRYLERVPDPPPPEDAAPAAETPRIADLREVFAFWTAVMRNGDEALRDRLKASELRARAAGAFLSRPEPAASQKSVFEIQVEVVDQEGVEDAP